MTENFPFNNYVYTDSTLKISCDEIQKFLHIKPDTQALKI